MYVYHIMLLLNLFSFCQYVYMVRVSIEGFNAPEVIPRMAAFSDVLVRNGFVVCEVMGGLSWGKVGYWV